MIESLVDTLVSILYDITPLQVLMLSVIGLVSGYLFCGPVIVSTTTVYRDFLLAAVFFAFIVTLRWAEGFPNWERTIGTFILFLDFWVFARLGEWIHHDLHLRRLNRKAEEFRSESEQNNDEA